MKAMPRALLDFIRSLAMHRAGRDPTAAVTGLHEIMERGAKFLLRQALK